MKKRVLLGVVISFIFLYLVLRNVDVKNLINILSSGKYLWILPALVTYALAFVSRSVRWSYLFLPVKKLSAKELFSSLIMGFAANNIFPMRFGEVVRAYIVGKKFNISKSASFATIVLERIMDGIGILILLGISIPFLPKMPPWTKKIILVSILMFIVPFIVAAVMIIRKHSFNWMLKASCIKKNLGEMLISKVNKFITGFEIIKDTRNFFMVVVLTLFVWFCETMNVFFLVRVVGINLSVFLSVFVLFVVVIGVAIPAAPSSIGTFEFFFVGGLIFFGVTKEQALAGGLVIHCVGFIIIILTGAYFFVKEGITYKEITVKE